MLRLQEIADLANLATRQGGVPLASSPYLLSQLFHASRSKDVGGKSGFNYDGGGLGKGGDGILKVDGTVVDHHRIERTVPFIFQWDETFDIGVDTGTSVNDKDYQVPFRFNGKLHKITLELRPVSLAPTDQKRT